MSGFEQTKPLIIDKSTKPRCFHGVKSLPLDYEPNKKVWRTDLFINWLVKFDQNMWLKQWIILSFLITI